MRRAQRREPVEIGGPHHRARRVVGRDEEDGARRRGEDTLEAGAVDRPCAVVLQPVRGGLDAIETCQHVEERIARLRDEHAISRIAQQLEQLGVRFARAGRQDDLPKRNRARFGIDLRRDRPPRVLETQRSRVVAAGARIGE